VTLARIGLAYLRTHKLATTLTIALLALGVAAVTLVFLTSAQLERRLDRDARDIDLIVGPKGSPTQLVLASLYGLDVPSGSIRWGTVQMLGAEPGVQAVIPVTLGDHYHGTRIVGTTRAYLDHYAARVQDGRAWQAPLEAVMGADVAARVRLAIGSTFIASHGLQRNVGEAHSARPYRIVGVLGRTGTLVDRLVLTDVSSYWTLHPQGTPDGNDLVAEPAPDDGRTVSAVLVRCTSASTVANVAAYVNARDELQAVSPVEETARLLEIAALNVDLLKAFAAVLLLSAGLTLFLALYHGLNERRYDVAVMRTLGATRGNVMSLLLFEGVLLALAGTIVGLPLGHALTSLLGFAMTRMQQFSVTGAFWHPAELWIVALALAIGALAAIVPAWRAREIDIAGTLARG
jgi:putative ABC transport system permease protein